MGSRLASSGLLCLCLLACKTTYEPRGYRLRDGLIPPLALRGTASFDNAARRLQVAEGVIVLLNDPQVRAYLER